MTVTKLSEDLIADAVRFLTDPEFREAPDEFYKRLLDGHRMLPLGNGTWLVGGHAEVRTVLRDNRFSRAARAPREIDYLTNDPRPEIREMAACQASMMLFTDPPEHARLRKFHRAPFMPRAVVHWADYVRELADELARELPRDRDFDLKELFALPIPERAICRILGVPAEDHRKWERWSEAILNIDRTGTGGGSSVSEAGDAMRAFGDYFAEIIERRRAEPADDLISELVGVEDGDDRLTDAELIGNLILLIIAGHETTANSIATIVVLLMSHRDQWERLIADDSLVEPTVEEVLRFDGAQRFMVPRVAVEDVQLGDNLIRKGDEVICILHAANRDPVVFDDPHRFDIARDASAHVAFGTGAHLCLGMHLARMELVAGLRALIRHHPGLRLAVDVDQLKSSPSPTVRGWQAVPCISSTP